MFTPDTLNLWGNAVGEIGLFALPALVGGLLVHWVTLVNFRRLATISGSHVDGQAVLRNVWGRGFADLIQFCGKVPLAVGAATGLLVSAGFVFNEIFVSWFPNFAFAYLLLGGALTLNLVGDRAVRWGQGIALVVVFSGLLALSLWVILFAKTDITVAPAPEPHGWPLTAVMVGVVVAMGFDLALYGLPQKVKCGGFPWRSVWAALASVGVVFILWGLAGLFTVPRAKLADTTISHIIIARTVLGDTGRHIMGGVVIGGVFAAVNALLFGIGYLLTRLIREPESSVDKRDPGGAPTRTLYLARIGLATLTALAMAGGWAGEPVLETFIRTGIVFWLFHHLMVNLTAERLLRRKRPFVDNYRRTGHFIVQTYALTGLILAITGLFWGEPDRRAMLILMTAIPVTAGLMLKLSSRIRQGNPKLRWCGLSDSSTKTH